MPRMRAAVAVVTQLLMIHLAIVSGAMACPMGDDGVHAAPYAASVAADGSAPSHAMTYAAPTAAGGGAPAHAGHAATGAAAPMHHAPHHAHHGAHCDPSCTPLACAAAGHCAAVAERDGAVSSARRVAWAPAPMSAMLAAPESPSAAPEPPPPRA